MAKPTNSKVPKIRFRGCVAEWEETPMGRLLTFKNGYNASGSQYGRGEKFINVLDIIRNDFITYDKIIGRVAITPKEFEKNKVVFGDLLFQRSSETLEEVGQANVYLDRDRPATFGGFVIRGKPLIEFDPEFFNVMLKTVKPRREITSRSGGSTRYNIGQESLEAAQVTIAPTTAEQTQIGGYFRELDRLIGLQQRKHDKLVTLKKAMLQKMFPQPGSTTPEIRFKGFEGDWAEKKLAELCDLFTDGDWIESKDQSASGIRLLQTGNVGVNEFVDKAGKARWISEDTFGRLKCEEVFPGDILISRLPDPAGRACIVPKLSHRVITAVDCTIVRTANSCDASFLVQHFSLDSYFETVNNYLGGGTRQRISRSALGRFTILVPAFDEQQKLGNYFRTLDELISKHAVQLEKLKQIKAACLEKMFV
jgi:type I restriction enzyme, S subunit